MAPYEIVDVQLNIAGKVTQTFRWWVSITFAVLAAAYVAGPDLAGAPCAIILFAYAMVSLSTLTLQNVYMTMAKGLAEESSTYQARSEIPSPALEVGLLDRLGDRRSLGVQLILRAVMFIATVGYVLFRAGYVG